MLSRLQSTRWKPVELTGWMRRAYGRRIMLETEGGSLRTRLDAEKGAEQLYLQVEVTGRMLIQLYCNDVLVLDELVAHGELDTLVDLSGFGCGMLDVELQLIPATYGEAKVGQELRLVAFDFGMEKIAV